MWLKRFILKTSKFKNVRNVRTWQEYFGLNRKWMEYLLQLYCTYRLACPNVKLEGRTFKASHFFSQCFVAAVEWAFGMFLSHPVYCLIWICHCMFRWHQTCCAKAPCCLTLLTSAFTPYQQQRTFLPGFSSSFGGKSKKLVYTEQTLLG